MQDYNYYDHSAIWVVIILILFMMICLVGLTIYIVHSNNKHRKKLEDIEIYKIHTSANISKDIPEILNLIIQESFDDYKIKTLLPLEEGIINSTREDEIRKALISIVTSRISDAALNKLSLFYNINNIADILADKIYITVMDYVLNHNLEVSIPNK